jgi:hypothetical protein
MAKKAQMTLVAEPEPETEPDTADAQPVRMWVTSVRLLHRAQQDLDTNTKAARKAFSDRLSNASKSRNEQIEADLPAKGAALKDWAERVRAYHQEWRDVTDEKSAELNKLKADAKRLSDAHAELMAVDPTAEQLALSFVGADGKAAPLGLSDETLSVVNSLARREIEAAHGNAPADIVALASALANVKVVDLSLGANASEALESGEDGEDLSSEVPDEEGDEASEETDEDVPF